MRSQFRGEAIYIAETDVHFPQLSVGDTLKFAAMARAPRNRLAGVSATSTRSTCVMSSWLCWVVSLRAPSLAKTPSP
ncbi:ABC-2 type transporter-domain-containing protein [Penicillium bovifimosum]|uniref:ABC-2 type transporter-domain-containing protein n=1 Tax=Penicillium bovifimosum TaxID=126998 RepID=A0A9W9KTV4_9EURO|nr:ABC-2 type transporter-domain-containing protein [Penicillium bovifimosum]KAJ5120741.1 ABC-2 type transporter-domain-containing protein [Penicillium bovifimosum]